jgi:endonuclease/exonuclease/phosphatase family metal-dependent hydrolase
VTPRYPRRKARQILALFIVALVALAALAPGSAQAAQRHPFKGKRQVVVETRNLFIGTDLDPIFQAHTFPELVGATTVAFLNVQATRFPERAQALAAEIAANDPDIVGLQEAVLLRTDTPADGPASPAEVVIADYLDILLQALEAQGAHYAPVAVSWNADNELPTALGFDVRVSDRDVILARTDLRVADLKLSNPQSGNYEHNVTVSTLGIPVTLTRGWTAVDVKIRGKSFRVVNTHLETSAAPPIQVAQAQELLAGPAATDMPVLLIGDYNSRADGTGTPTYGVLRAAGFADAWSDLNPGDPGLTCCWETHLLSPTPPFDERLDLVLARGGLRALDIDILGEDPLADRTPSGLFHSDHAGVVAELSVPR